MKSMRSSIEAQDAPLLRTFSSYTGDEFDRDAIDRMTEGCYQLLPFMSNLNPKITGRCIEFGPFLNPILEPSRFPGLDVTFVDADVEVVRTLNCRYLDHPRLRSVCVNLNLSPSLIQKEILLHHFAEEPFSFDHIVVSQVLNYVDYLNFFNLLSKLSFKGTRLFINNVVEYGLPECFSDQRPRSDQDILDALQSHGWNILYQDQIPSISDRQPASRLLLVAEKRV